MKKLVVFGVLALFLGGIVFGLYLNPAVAASIKEQIFGGGEPDIPDFALHKVDKQEFMMRRSENIALYRGLDKDRPVDPQLRVDAIGQMERQQEELANSLVPQAAWVEIGPNPIPNAQVETPPTTPASGRTIAIAVHPTNPNIVYVGTAMGGLYRSLDGGTTWTRLTETALSLAIGAIAIAPSQPDTIYVGTGEPNFSGDSFFGVGVYRIDNASTTANLTGPLNDDAADADIFTGRAIGNIVVHPTNPATIFVATTSGIGGIGSVQNNVLPSRGIYRSTDATSADPTFTKLTGLQSGGDFSIRDMAIDPLNANLLVCNLIANGGGIYVSTDALAPSPTFVRTVTFTGTSISELTAEFAIQHTAGPNPTIYAATGNLGGRVLINTDGGTTWTQQIDNDFCSFQCFYDIAVAVDPTNAANVYLGGSPNLVFGRSTNSGATFTGDGVSFTAGLHVDSHAIAIAPSLPRVAYFGSDGGIYKTNDVNATPIVWTSLNNTQFTATQFMGLAVHPIDPNFTIGGTQDNGTNFYQPSATWFRADFGDGGYAVIDQSSLNNVAVNMYHTYFNAPTLKGYGYVPGPATAMDGLWTFRGCNGVAGNGIPCGGSVLFYAPLEQGPGNPNTIYYGADTLYRSDNLGVLHTAVSQSFGTTPISAIGISPQNDNVRIVGLASRGTTPGGLFGTTTGSAALIDLDPTNVIPNNFVARTVIDPNNVNTAYVTLNGFGLAANVYKTTNLNAAPPTWTASSTGLPAVPVNGFIVDPIDSTRLYAGTDIGVYTSGDGGANWIPFGTGLPRVAVFDLAKTSGNLIRIATHGRGMWQIPALAPPTAANVSVSGRVMVADGRGLRNALVTLTDSAGVSRQAVTSSFGYYRLDDVPVGETYVATVTSKRFSYAPQFITLLDELADLDFTPEP